MTTTHETPRVWIGALGAYNAGRLIGEWCDAVDVDELEECYRGEWDDERAFAMDYAEEIGALEESATWPNDCIDWERAAREIFQHGAFCIVQHSPGGAGYVFELEA